MPDIIHFISGSFSKTPKIYIWAFPYAPLSSPLQKVKISAGKYDRKIFTGSKSINVSRKFVKNFHFLNCRMAFFSSFLSKLPCFSPFVQSGGKNWQPCHLRKRFSQRKTALRNKNREREGKKSHRGQLVRLKKTMWPSSPTRQPLC